MAVYIRLMNQRREQIVNILSERERVTVNELSEMLNVSSVTVRGDLNFLAEEGRVVRVHGGAALAKPSMRQEMTFASRQRHRAAEKHAVARLAATLVKPIDSILLDSSTTALAVGQAVKASPTISNVTVLTTGLWTAVAIMDSPNIHTIMAGGSLGSTSGSVSGPITREMLGRYNINKAFVGALGLTLEDGLSGNDPLEIELRQYIVENAKEVIAVVDGSKFGQTGLASFARIEQLDYVVTESSAPAEMVEALRERGVQVMVAAVEP
ncbi:MAG: DeoR/GlpR family DNA-binding transcription regulator [Anaerolineae bacterium]|nr:DeoR/GlpR family DNA-binding transcription regulator [Anaerolineae bacterium]NUQ03030.1 DeoR/GlpR transcriptional regulator [Anaerolineae bacterium]